MSVSFPCSAGWVAEKASGLDGPVAGGEVMARDLSGRRVTGSDVRAAVEGLILQLFGRGCLRELYSNSGDAIVVFLLRHKNCPCWRSNMNNCVLCCVK